MKINVLNHYLHFIYIILDVSKDIIMEDTSHVSSLHLNPKSVKKVDRYVKLEIHLIFSIQT